MLFPSDTDSLGNRKAPDKESVDLRPPDYLLPGCKDLPLMPLQPIREDRKVSGLYIYIFIIFEGKKYDYIIQVLLEEAYQSGYKQKTK